MSFIIHARRAVRTLTHDPDSLAGFRAAMTALGRPDTGADTLTVVGCPPAGVDAAAAVMAAAGWVPADDAGDGGPGAVVFRRR
ncbi:MAG: hypothetical protein LCH56_17345 [Proteobacteria bacterium]|nr:hypothetical protein [Pseudomonadota bacterium]